MGVPLSWLLLLALLLQTATREGAQAEAPGASTLTSKNCRRKCGNIDVPYPFGLEGDDDACHFLDENTTISRSFVLFCNHTYNPPKLFTRSSTVEIFDNIYYNRNYTKFNDFKVLNTSKGIEVIDVNISSGNLRVLLPLAYDCYDGVGNYSDSKGVYVSLTDPFVLSHSENVFKAVGCDAVVGFSTEEYNSGGCVSGCNSLKTAVDGECKGSGCCEARVLPGIEAFNTFSYEKDPDSKIYEFNPCFYYFMVEMDNYTFKISDLNMTKTRQFPVILHWYIGKHGCNHSAKNASSYACVAGNSECTEHDNSTTGYFCQCSKGYEGNPYVHDGCRDIDECEEGQGKYKCYGKCTNTVGGYDCRCPNGYTSIDPKTEKCFKKSNRTRNLILASGGLLLLSFIGFLLCLEYQRRKINVLRMKHFKSNGGTFLQELLSAHQSTFRIFTYDQLKKATNSFSMSNILGRGGFGVVYKGIIEDDIQIAVKKSTMVGERNSGDFANELFILSQVNHSSIVKLLGCCLEEESPMLIYEFIPGGTLFDYIHGNERYIGFATRLRIATQVAEAFKYLHFDASPPILHGDIKSANILLGDDLQPKVSDFGTSRLAPDGNAKFTSIVQGTCGYLDPEYLATGALTDKSDVFSFGVVLLELLTRKEPLSSIVGSATEQILYVRFLSCAKANKLVEILDLDLVKEGPSAQVEKLVEIALECLEMEGENRPTMKEVASRLESIKESVEFLQRCPSFSHGNKETKPLLEGISSSVIGISPRSAGFSVELAR